MYRRKEPNRFRVFYYSHPYLVIFNLLIVYNLIIIALAAWIMTWLMKDVVDPSTGQALGYNLDFYLKNLQYCVVFTANTGGIYDDAPNAVIIMKIILSVIQMVSFTGALIGLATSMLQNLFANRIHNVGKLKLKNHYVLLNWSPCAANLIREFSFMDGRKTIVVLTERDRDEIVREIDDLFLETGTSKKKIKIFVKHGNPASRKDLKDISIDKALSIALLLDSNWGGQGSGDDVGAFKLLMNIFSITKKVNVVVEAKDESVMNSITQLISSSPELAECPISFISRGDVVGNLLSRSAINSSFDDLYYYLLSYKGDSFYMINQPYSIEEGLKRFNNAIPVMSYQREGKPMLYMLSRKDLLVYRRLWKKNYKETAKYVKNIRPNSFALYLIGENGRSEAIKKEINAYNALGEGKIVLQNYPFNTEVDALLDDLNSRQGHRKILLLSDDSAEEKDIDANVFTTLLKLKASGRLPRNVEISAELLGQSNSQSLKTLNVDNIIISNQMLALCLLQLMTHPEGKKFYSNFLSVTAEQQERDIDFDIRNAEEILDLKEEQRFSSRGSFIHAVYEASGHEYLPIGFVGEKEKKDVLGAVVSGVTTVVGAGVKAVSSVTSALAINPESEETPIEESDIMIISNKQSKKRPVVLRKGMKLVLVHYRKIVKSANK